MAAKFLGLLWHWWWLSVCRAWFSLRIYNDRQHVAPTLLPLTIGVSEIGITMDSKNRFYFPIDPPLFSESSLLLRRTSEGRYMLLHRRELLDIHGFHKPAILEQELIVHLQKGRIVILREKGLSYAEIARQIGGSVTCSGVRKLCLRYEKTKSVENKAKSGRKKCTSATDDRKIKRLCLQDRKISSEAIRCEMNAAGIAVSSRTIRRLSGFGLHTQAGIPRRKHLNKKQREKRVKWAKEHIKSSENQWRQVIWSDESKISLFGSDGRKYVRRRVGEALHPDCIEATTKNPTNVMI
ncbi:unnamed protein product [Larinioides sclopetarius]|uniref:Transposase Tc1-like domain-containing protein n=1 Tax=Larinioides sclopetarius TaxID=280406 RepID=A0AAV2BKG4_9ARAC